MKYRYKFLINFIIILFLFIGAIFYINFNYIFSNPNAKIDVDKVSFGIIDGTLSKNHSNVIKINENSKKEKRITHGDKILDFMNNYAPNCSFCYFNAEEKNKISTDNLLKGLQWMLDNNVQCVCISLSGKRYSKKIDDWVNEHSNRIKIYASYNNTDNTLDYPAGYYNVIGVGSSKKIKAKENDVIYSKSKIIMWGIPLKIYNGNSYLTPYYMINDNMS